MRVSVIIPAHNAENSLKLTLDSVVGQTKSAHEIIVINDGSTDNTEATAKSYGERIIYLEQENAGQGAARNHGLQIASGDAIAFLDADDFWRPQFLERCCAFLREHPEAIAVNTGLLTRLVDGLELRQPASLQGVNAPEKPYMLDDFFAFWAQHDHVRTGSALIRKTATDLAGLQRADLRVSQDLEYWGLLATYGSWGYIPEALWVGNSRAAAAGFAWLRKYRKRRKLCPTVESWQERLLPRLNEAQLPSFRIVRGRVAAGYAHNHILGGNPAQSRHIIATYGEELPNNKLTWFLRLGHRCGAIGWWLACRVVVAREYGKVLRWQLRKSDKQRSK